MKKTKKRVATIIHDGNGVSRHSGFAIRSVGYTWSLAKPHVARLVILFGHESAVEGCFLCCFLSPFFPFSFLFSHTFYFFWIRMEGSGLGSGGTKKKRKKSREKGPSDRFLPFWKLLFSLLFFSLFLLAWYPINGRRLENYPYDYDPRPTQLRY